MNWHTIIETLNAMSQYEDIVIKNIQKRINFELKYNKINDR